MYGLAFTPVFTSTLAVGDGWLELCSALGSALSQLFLIDLSSFIYSNWAVAVLQHLLSESGFVLLHLLLNSKIAVYSFFSRSPEEGSFFSGGPADPAGHTFNF